MKIQKFDINRVKVFGQELERQFKSMYTPETVERLRYSIKDGGLKVLPGRLIEDNGYDVEIPYGRHRLEAAKAEGLKTINIAVCKWDDMRMIKEAFHENSHFYHNQEEIARQALCFLKFREILTNIFKECDTFKVFSKKHPDIVSKLGLDEQGFKKIKNQMKIPGCQGVGYRTIAKMFNGEWSYQTIRRDIKNAVEKKRIFDPDVFEEDQVEQAEETKEAKELFGDPKPVEANKDIPNPQDITELPGKKLTVEKGPFEDVDLTPFMKDPEESGYTHEASKKDPRADNALKARASKKAKEIEMTEELKKVVGTLFKRLQLAEDHINHNKVGVLLSMIKLTETKNAWSQMDKIPNLKNAFDMRINKLRKEFKKILTLYALIKTNSYEVNMTIADLEETIKRGEGK